MNRNKEVGVRVSLKGGADTLRRFHELGLEGHRALAQIEAQGREANAVLKQINASAQVSREVFGGLQRLRGGVAGLVTGLVANATVQQVRDVARGVAEVGDAAKRAGLDIRAFQELKYVAEQNRIGVDQLVDGIKELNLRADEFITTGGGSAAEAFERLGYNAERLREKLKDPSALFSEIIGKLQSLDRAAQIRVMDEIFGGSAGELFVQLIEQGEQGIRDTITAATELGAVLDEDLVKKADDLDRKFSEIATTVDQGLKRVIVEAAHLLGVFLDQFNSIENRTQINPLQNQLAHLYNRRAGVRDSIATLEDDIAKMGEFNPLKMLRQGELAELRQEFEDLTTEADRLLSRITELQGRGSTPPVVPKIDLPGSLPSWEDFSSTFKSPTSGAGSSRSSTTTDADRQREKIRGVVQALQDELAALNMTAVEREVMNQLRRAGVEAASREGQTIRGLVEQLDKERDSIELVESAMESLGGTAKDVLGSIVSGFREGKEAGEVLADVTDRLINKLLTGGIDMGVNALTGWLSSAFRPATAGFVPGLTGPSLFGQAHSGWLVGRGSAPQSRHLATLPRMHNGGLSREEALIVARRDEGVFTPRQMDNADSLVQALVRNAQQARQQAGPLHVEIVNPAGDKRVESAEMRQGRDGIPIARVVLAEVKNGYARGEMDGLMRELYGINRKGR
ncbi:phage tail tape measure protein [uncultured Devosia sp.]|uniref:phage tail tape measure protein n=1 Tax=uncultured Devosia sp. TaxID=211434 RepID=UPI00263736BA|nr:phage tail tape measure protein [uncultured Devosia sp.]